MFTGSVSRTCRTVNWIQDTAKLMEKYPQPVITVPVHRGLKEIDPSLFNVKIPLLAARVPGTHIKDFTSRKFKNQILRVHRVPPIVTESSSHEYRRVLLRTDDKGKLPQEFLEALKFDQIELVDHILDLNYDHWSTDQILQAVLPEDLLDEAPSSFSQVGHIGHLNLREPYLPYKYLIGQVLLDKNKSLRTIVNKLDIIDNTYRNFQMEVIAGEPNFLVEHSESNCIFGFDFSKVYWNSRLQMEHAALVESFSPRDIIVDAFAGVGPFAIPAAKKGCGVLASDLNPESASALKSNAERNKVTDCIRCENQDARDFIRQSVKEVWERPFELYKRPLSSKARGKLTHEALRAAALERSKSPHNSTLKTTITESTPSSLAAAKASPSRQEVSLPSVPPPPPPPPPPPDIAAAISSSEPTLSESAEDKVDSKRRLVNHFIMNLPGSAIEFLDAFKGLYSSLYELEGFKEAVKDAGGENAMPMVHCYCFTKDTEGAERDILQKEAGDYCLFADDFQGWYKSKD